MSAFFGCIHPPGFVSSTDTASLVLGNKLDPLALAVNNRLESRSGEMTTDFVMSRAPEDRKAWRRLDGL